MIKKKGFMHCNSLLIGPEQHKPIICYFFMVLYYMKKNVDKNQGYCQTIVCFYTKQPVEGGVT